MNSLTSNGRLSAFSKLSLLLAGVALLMVIAMIAYPAGYDQAAFSVGGEMVLQKGAIPYRDFIDTKPPLVFYIYALSSVLLGHHEWAIRALDILVQIGASLYFFRILRRYFGPSTALLATSIALIEYASLGFWMTAQAEGFAILPSLVLLDMTMRVSERESGVVKWGIIAGLAAAALFFLKFTFLIGFFAAILFLLMTRQPLREKLKFIFTSSGILLLSIVVYLIYLYYTGSLSYFTEGLAWVSKYAAIDPLLGLATISEKYYILFPDRLISSATLTLFIFGIWGIGNSLKERATEQKASPILGLAAITLSFQLAGVLFERKMFPYHYSRALWAFAPFIALGMQSFFSRARRMWELIRLQDAVSRLAGRLLFVTMIGVALFFSPLPRSISQSYGWTALRLSGGDVGKEIHHRIHDYFSDEQRAAGSYLKQRLGLKEQMFFWGNDVSIYFWAHTLPTTLCLTVTPLRTSWTPEHWKQQMMVQLVQSKPSYFVVESGDDKSYITGSELDSYGALKAWPELYQYFSANYASDTTIGHYMIYRRHS